MGGCRGAGRGTTQRGGDAASPEHVHAGDEGRHACRREAKGACTCMCAIRSMRCDASGRPTRRGSFFELRGGRARPRCCIRFRVFSPFSCSFWFVCLLACFVFVSFRATLLVAGREDKPYAWYLVKYLQTTNARHISPPDNQVGSVGSFLRALDLAMYQPAALAVMLCRFCRRVGRYALLAFV